jgi:hypothetical protein
MFLLRILPGLFVLITRLKNPPLPWGSDMGRPRLLPVANLNLFAQNDQRRRQDSQWIHLVILRVNLIHVGEYSHGELGLGGFGFQPIGRFGRMSKLLINVAIDEDMIMSTSNEGREPGVIGDRRPDGAA